MYVSSVILIKLLPLPDLEGHVCFQRYFTVSDSTRLIASLHRNLHHIISVSRANKR